MDLGNRKTQKWPDWTSSGYVFVACFLYYGDEPLGSIKSSRNVLSYWTVHHLKLNQLDVTLWKHQYISTYRNRTTHLHSRRLLRMNVTTFETCWAIKNFHQVGSIYSTRIAECYRTENGINDTSSTLHCRSSAVGIATKLEVWWSRVWIPAESKIFFFFSKTYRPELGPPGLLFSWWRHGYSHRQRDWGMKLTTHSSTTAKVKNELRYTSTPPPPQNTFMVWTGHTWLHSQFAPHREHNVRHFRVNKWILYRNIIAVYCDRDRK